jgi:alkylation response protein AidB-like acyl-CoA dehydrogenase
MTPALAVDFFTGWVRPQAGAIDQDLATLRGALSEMARRGLLGMRIPRDLGGLGFEPVEFRRVQEASARASGALAFLESQHQSASALLSKSGNRELRTHLLPRMADGRATSAIAFSHLRRSGAPALAATPSATGWRLTGRLPWVTGWGLFTHCTTAATLPDGRILFAIHPLAASPELRPTAPLALAAMGVTQTVALDVHDLIIPETDVLDVHEASWIQENDRIAVALQSPLALGCAQAGIDVLRGESRKKSHRGAAAAADRLESDLADIRAEAYRAMEEKSDLERGLRARAAAIELAVRAAHAAVIASAGAGNLMSHDAQRVYREALAFSVLALTPPLQEAVLARLSGSRDEFERPS